MLTAGQARSRRQGAPGRARVARAVRERDMVEAATRLFAQRGYLAASMEEVATRAGVSKPMLYAYFGSKEGLFAACGRVAGERLRERVRQAADAPELPPDQRLWRGLVGVFDFIAENRALWSIHQPPGGEAAAGLIGAGAAEGRAAMSELMGELLAAAAMDEGIAPEAVEHTAALAHAFTAAVIAMAEWWLRHPEEPKELQALRMMNFAWVGFENMLRGQLWLPEA